MCARSCAWKVGHSTRQKLERSEIAIAAVDCHSSPAGAGREIGRVASFRAAALAMPARKSASLLARLRCRAAYHLRGRKPPVLPPRENQPKKTARPGRQQRKGAKTQNTRPRAHPQEASGPFSDCRLLHPPPDSCRGIKDPRGSETQVYSRTKMPCIQPRTGAKIMSC